ncbi:MAG: hypothetical protein ACW99Q_02205, partial [Candidatus Kariarchaeaceae archaeon]
KRDTRTYIPIFILLGYLLRRLRTFLPGEFLVGSIVLGFTGVWIIVKIIGELRNSNPVVTHFHN